MPTLEGMLDLYLHLAQASESQKRPLQRDKFLVLSVRIAHKAGFDRIAEDCRKRVLKNNPHHILKGYASVAEALKSEDIRYYTKQLMRIYPFEKAEYLLQRFRASGYEGSHGYGELLRAISATPSRQSAAPPKQQSKVSKNGNSRTGADHGPSAPRPQLKRALANTEPKVGSKAAASEPEVLEPPIPLDSAYTAYAGSDYIISPWTFWAWILFAFAVGVAVGGTAVMYMLPMP